MPKTVAILQSNYVPWKGYFDVMAAVDEFIIYDDAQYTRRDWRNRNRFKSPSGIRWLTIPVQVKGRYLQTIAETVTTDQDWTARHWATLSGWYRRAPYFADYKDALEAAYLGLEARHLSEINRRFLELLADLLGISTPLRSSSEYGGAGNKTERLVKICQAAGATRYLSGPAARDYLDEQMFAAAGIVVDWMAYEGYPDYQQLYPPFEHHVSVLDLILSVGPSAPQYLLGAK
jgi:WbqC-like protein family